MKLERYEEIRDDGVFPSDTGEWTDYNDAARLIAKLRAACQAALGAFENNNAIDWDDLEEAIEEAEGIEPDNAGPGGRSPGRVIDLATDAPELQPIGRLRPAAHGIYTSEEMVTIEKVNELVAAVNALLLWAKAVKP